MELPLHVVKFGVLTWILLVLTGSDVVWAEPDLALKREVLRFYDARRQGDAGDFESRWPLHRIEAECQADQRRERLLAARYGVELDEPILEAEMQRIETTSKDPKGLEALKARFKNREAFLEAVVRPLLVERLLYQHFIADTELHAPQRRQAEAARRAMLEGDSLEGMSTVAWRVASLNAAQSSGGRYQNLATVGFPDDTDEEAFDFERLPVAWQARLQRELQHPGDVSSVMELPGSYVVFRLAARNAGEWQIDQWSVAKRDFRTWEEGVGGS